MVRRPIQRRFLRLIATCVALIAFGSGCLPIPHTTQRFPAIHGRVIDSSTGQSIDAAVVAIHEHPDTTATTDANGTFHFSRKVNFHLLLGLGPCPTDWPEGEEWPAVLDVSRASYEPRQVDVTEQAIPPCSDGKASSKDVGDLALTPTTRPTTRAAQ